MKEIPSFAFPGKDADFDPGDPNSISGWQNGMKFELHTADCLRAGAAVWLRRQRAFPQSHGYSISMLMPLSFHWPSEGMKPSWYFTFLGEVSKWPFRRSTPCSSIFASSSETIGLATTASNTACFSIRFLKMARSFSGGNCSRNGFDILAWNAAKLSAATASLSVTRMLLTSTSCTKGIGISSAWTLVETSAASTMAAATHLKRAQYGIDDP